MDLNEEQRPDAEISEVESDAEVKPEVNGEPDTPEETDEEKNARVAQEAAERAKHKEEKRQQSVQKRFNELTAEKYASQKLATQLAEQNARILALLEGKQGTAVQTSGEPTRDQFADYEDFVTARAEYRAEQKAQAIIEKFSKEQEEKSTSRERETSERTNTQKFLERRDALEKSIPDFKEVVADWEPQLPNNVAELITKMVDGPLIAYHMAKNPELEKQFREQPVELHGILLGQLSASLKSPQKVTAAPAPGRPVAGKPSPVEGDFTGKPEDYYAWAMKQQKAGKLR
jgi:hypothetical protein